MRGYSIRYLFFVKIVFNRKTSSADNIKNPKIMLD